MWLGRVLGFLFGYLMTHSLIGGMLGFVLGYFFDRGLKLHIQRGGAPWFGNSVNQIRQAYFKAVFSVMGYVAKADGRVSEQEIQMARLVMDRMSLNAEQRQSAIQYFTQGKQADFDLDATLQRLLRECSSQRMLLKMFIFIQLQAASADGIMRPQQQKILQYISQRLGFGTVDFEEFTRSFRAEQAYTNPQQNPQQKLQQAYTILGVKPSTSDAEVKKAYRRLMSQNHPDKLAAKGLPAEMMKLATEKTQEIKAAYDEIIRARAA